MNKTLRLILDCIGIAVLALFIVNLSLFGFELIKNGIGDNWSFLLKHGVFYSNGNPIGLVLGSPKANGFMLLIFLLNVTWNYRKGKFSAE